MNCGAAGPVLPAIRNPCARLHSTRNLDEARRMGFLSRLFGRARPSSMRAESAADPAPRRPLKQQKEEARINYDPGLIQRLKADHQELFRIYGATQSALKAGEFAQVATRLGDLKLALQTHVIMENVKFYVYVQESTAADGDMKSFLHDVRKEMDGIVRAAVRFVNKWTGDPVTAARADEFKRELDGIGDMLTKRVTLEESRLYTLYEPRP
jgi:hypothetical protein